MFRLMRFTTAGGENVTQTKICWPFKKLMHSSKVASEVNLLKRN